MTGSRNLIFLQCVYLQISSQTQLRSILWLQESLLCLDDTLYLYLYSIYVNIIIYMRPTSTINKTAMHCLMHITFQLMSQFGIHASYHSEVKCNCMHSKQYLFFLKSLLSRTKIAFSREVTEGVDGCEWEFYGYKCMKVARRKYLTAW